MLYGCTSTKGLLAESQRLAPGSKSRAFAGFFAYNNQSLLLLSVFCLGTLALTGCTSFATPVGTLEHLEDASTIVGYFRYYMVHVSRGEISRIDSTRLRGNSQYAVKVSPGQHLVVIDMTQVSALNPLMIGGGSCAIIFDFAPRRTYQIEAPPFGAYWHFWFHTPLGSQFMDSRFSTAISITVSGEGESDQHIKLPMDCSSESKYCRVSSDCVESNPQRVEPPDPGQDTVLTQCIYDEGFPVGTCSVVATVPGSP